MSNYYIHPPAHFKEICKLDHNWETKKLKYIKNNIKDKLKEIKGEECFYCKMPIDSGSNPGDIEHIVHKGNLNYKEFTYHPMNLTLTCKKCNTAKGTKESLILERQNIKYKFNEYLTDPNDYSIVHTHLDTYEEHLRLKNYIFTESINDSKKGINTIEMCNLYRLDLALSRVKQIKHFYGLGGPAKALIIEESADKNEIMENIKSLLTEQQTSFFRKFLRIDNNSNIIQIVNELWKVKDILFLTNEENREVLNEFVMNYDSLKQYFELIKYINKTKTLITQMKLHFDKTLIIPNSTKFILNQDGLEKLHQLLKNGHLQCRDSITLKLNQYLLSINNSEVGFLFNGLLDKERLLKIIKIVYEIFQNSTIKELIPGLDGYDFRFLNQNIEELKDEFKTNPQLELMSNLEWLYINVISRYDRQRIGDMNRTINACIEYMDL